VQILPELNWSEEVEAIGDEITRVIQALSGGDMDTLGQVRRDHLYMMLGRVKRYLGGANELELG
jgi:hypothetical protein